jgi:membrane protein DedA with SNARE-associated domain
MTNKLALFSSMTPAEQGALLGSLIGAGGAGATAYLNSDKDKYRNAALAALAGGGLGAGVGYGAGRYLGGPNLASTSKGLNLEELLAIRDAMLDQNKRVSEIESTVRDAADFTKSVKQSLPKPN